MLYSILGLRGGRYIPIGEANGLHAQAAILSYRKATGVGGKMQARLATPVSVPHRIGNETPLNVCEGYKDAKGMSTPSQPKPWYAMGDKELSDLCDGLRGTYGKPFNADRAELCPFERLRTQHLMTENAAHTLMSFGVSAARKLLVRKPVM